MLAMALTEVVRCLFPRADSWRQLGTCTRAKVEDNRTDSARVGHQGAVMADSAFPGQKPHEPSAASEPPTVVAPVPASTPPPAGGDGTVDFRAPVSTFPRSDGVTDPTVTLPAEGSANRRGRFTILRVLAQGGLGCVSLARDEELRRAVALR